MAMQTNQLYFEDFKNNPLHLKRSLDEMNLLVLPALGAYVL